jgi:hypothetical protein
MASTAGSLRSQAYVLPDGRHLFNTNDGQRVFGESGAQLKREELDPGLVGDKLPKWEAMKPQLDARHDLEQERGKLLEFQAKVDKAREESGRTASARKNSTRLVCRSKRRAGRGEAEARDK